LKLKLFYLYFFNLVILSLIIRYPDYNHASGSTDSFFNHSEAILLSNLGFHFYYLNPLSFFGAYPLSRNMGGSSLLSALSEITGTDMEFTILILSPFLGILGSINYAIFYRSFDTSKIMFLIIFLIASFSPLMLTYSSWNYSYRLGTFALYPLVYWSFFRFTYNFKENIVTNFILMSFLIFSLVSFHRISIFFVHFVFVCICTYTINIILNNYRIFRINSQKSNKVYLVYFFILFFVSYLYSVFGSFYEADKDVQKFAVFDILGIVMYFINFATDYTKYIGLFSLFLPFGIYYSIEKYFIYKRSSFLLPIVLIIAYIPFMHDVQYAGNYIYGFLLILVGLGISEIIKSKLIKETMDTFTILFLSFLICLIPQYVVVNEDTPSYYHNQSGAPISNGIVYPEDYNLGLYLKHQTDSDLRIICNSGGIEDELASYSENIPYGIPITYNEDQLKNIGLLELATGNYDYILASDIKIESITSLYWDVFRNVHRTWDEDRTRIYLDYYTYGNGDYYIVFSNYSNNTHVSFYSYNSYESTFFRTVTQDFYVVYSDYNHNVRNLNYND